jgi:hypothetical protein
MADYQFDAATRCPKNGYEKCNKNGIPSATLQNVAFVRVRCSRTLKKALCAVAHLWKGRYHFAAFELTLHKYRVARIKSSTSVHLL